MFANMLDAHVLVKIHLILFSDTILLLILQNPSLGKKDVTVKENYHWYSYKCNRFDHGEFICLFSNLLAFSTIFVVS
jgi:hypothetical protein